MVAFWEIDLEVDKKAKLGILKISGDTWNFKKNLICSIVYLNKRWI